MALNLTFPGSLWSDWGLKQYHPSPISGLFSCTVWLCGELVQGTEALWSTVSAYSTDRSNLPIFLWGCLRSFLAQDRPYQWKQWEVLENHILVWTHAFAGYQNLCKQQLKLYAYSFVLWNVSQSMQTLLTGNNEMALTAPNLPCSLLLSFIR